MKQVGAICIIWDRLGEGSSATVGVALSIFGALLLVEKRIHGARRSTQISGDRTPQKHGVCVGASS